MASTVTTVTTVFETPTRVALKLKHQDFLSACDQKLTELMKITTESASWEDPLSFRLFRWCTHVLTFKIPPKTSTEELPEIIFEMAKVINKVKTEILVSPFDGTTLSGNLLLASDGETWTEDSLNDYMSLFKEEGPFSPFNKVSLTGPQKVHEFAQKVLSWANFVEEIIHNYLPPKKELVTLRSCMSEKATDAEKLAMYFVSANHAQTIWGLNDTADDIVDNSTKILKELVTKQQESEEELQRFREAAQKEHQEILRDIENIKQNHQEDKAFASAQLKDLYERLEVVNKKLKEAAERGSALERRVQGLHQDLQQAQHDIKKLKLRRICSIQ